MDPTRDNPLIRIKAFFDGLGIFTFFALLLALIFGFGAAFGIFRKGQEPEDAAGKIRYEIKTEVDEAQAAVISPEQIEAVIPTAAKALIASKPAAVEKPEQIVPGSETARKLEEAPGPDLSNIDAPAEDEDAPIDPAQMEIGKAQFLVCGACHGQNGEGTAAAPPLAGSEWVTGPVSNLILIQLRGLKGPITVKGQQYEFPAGMTPMAYQTDEQIAGVLTYIRNSFGNKGSAVKPEQVASLRGEVGKPQVTAEELTQP
ncbi:c-type cytochrome [Luteolibacter algae]|uniref:C-type cytochrome n=1 Tax=Luteolibacter algae TaxID=454151 RepID=A0ABW5DAB5_9BACT